MADLFEDIMLAGDPASSQTLASLANLGVVTIEGGGNCPVQIEGHIVDELKGVVAEYYFRARGSHWSVQISRPGRVMSNDGWTMRRLWPSDVFGAGWMKIEDATKMLERAIQSWRVEGAPLPPLYPEEKIRGSVGGDLTKIRTTGLLEWLEETSGAYLDILRSYLLCAEPITGDKLCRLINKAEISWLIMNNEAAEGNNTAAADERRKLVKIGQKLRKIQAAEYTQVVDALVSFYCTPLPDERLWKNKFA